jgi:hypothetical protein
LELATALNGSVLVVSKGGQSQALAKLRELIVEKLLTPILSRDPNVGLSSLAPGIRAQELENPSPPGVFHCIGIASFLVSAIYISLQHQPDPAFSKYVPTFLMLHPPLRRLHKLTYNSRIFEKSEALEISLLVWYYTLEATERNLAAGLLVHIMHGEISHVKVTLRWFRYFSGEDLAAKCKEILEDESKSDTRDGANLHLINIMCNPQNPGSRFAITFCTEGVHKVVLDVVYREMDRPIINWDRMQHAGTILTSVSLSGAIFFFEYSDFMFAVEFLRPKQGTLVKPLSLLNISNNWEYSISWPVFFWTSQMQMITLRVSPLPISQLRWPLVTIVHLPFPQPGSSASSC